MERLRPSYEATLLSGYAPGTATAGGFGTVFLARRGEQLHALRLLSLKDHSGWAEREVVVLSRVRHRNVARLRGFWARRTPPRAGCCTCYGT